MNIEQKTITSLEVAEMMEVEHSKILRKLEGDTKQVGIIPTLSKTEIGSADYFAESTYEDAQGKQRKCYLVTKLGCDFLANKFTGEKGILFTARYVKKFREMEEVIHKPMTAMEIIKLQNEALIEVNEKVSAVEQNIENFKETLPLLGLDCDRITSAVKARGTHFLGGHESNAYADSSLRQRVYSDIHREVKRQFGVTTYKAIRRNQCDKAVSFVNSYDIPFVLQDEIKDVNSQMRIGDV